MKKALPILFLFVLAAVSQASDLNLKLQSQGSPTIRVSPGATVEYAVVGELTDSKNEGLAMFSMDLSFDGGGLSPATTPSTSPMIQFTKPFGLTNPAGFGGTVKNGRLVQVGGAQNTINNAFAPYPNGTVITGIAKPGQPATLVTGTLTAPYKVGDFYLTPYSIFANAIRAGETGSPVWKVDAVNAKHIQRLKIEVVALTGNDTSLSVSEGETLTLELNAGPANAGRKYWVLGSVSGTSPGTSIPGSSLSLPLNFDWYYLYTRLHPNSAILEHSVGTLDSQGRARTRFHPSKKFVGMEVNHAFLLFDDVDFVSNAVAARVVQ